MPPGRPDITMQTRGGNAFQWCAVTRHALLETRCAFWRHASLPLGVPSIDPAHHLVSSA